MAPPETEAPVDQPALVEPQAPVQPNNGTVAEPGISNMALLGLGAAIMLLGGLGYFFWRKRKEEGQYLEDTAVESMADEQPVPMPATEPALPAEELSSNTKTQTVVETPESESASSGFVTTKIKERVQSAKADPELVPVIPTRSDELTITFTAERASSTLLNAVVGYQIEIKNISAKPLKALQVSGTMIQADNNIAESAASSQGIVLHEIASLSAGQSKTISGDIRLPLNAFQPMDFQSQKLFVPLVLLRFDYFDEDGNSLMQAANFLVGAEHNPPREKMAPFRLDLGPRSFGKVAHRRFQS